MPFERAGQNVLKFDQHLELLDALHLLYQLPYFRLPNSATERTLLGRGETQRAHHLREVGIGSRSHQELELLVAVALVRRPSAEPWSVPVAGIDRRPGRRHRLRRSAVHATNADARKVARRSLFEAQLGSVAYPFVPIP